MSIFSLDHIHVFVRSAEAFGDFLQEFFGAEYIQKLPDRVDVRLGDQNIFISAVPEAEGRTGDIARIDHFGLRVRDLDAVVHALRQKNARFAKEPRTVGPGVRIAFVQAPENIVIELLQRD